MQPSEAQSARILPAEIDQREHTADQLAERRRSRRADQPPRKYRHKNRVEHHIRHARRDRNEKPELGLFGRREEALEFILQHIKRQRREDDPAIDHAVVQHPTLRAHQARQRAQKKDAKGRDHHGHSGRDPDVHRKDPIGRPVLALAHFHGDERRAARSEHEADAAEDHQQRHNEVDGGKRRFPGVVRHEEAVHDAVDRREDHHHDRRQCEAQQSGIGKMIRKLNFHLSCPFFCKSRRKRSVSAR